MSEVPANSVGELLILPDGQVLVHNLTPELAGLLAEICPGDPAIACRVDGCAVAKNPVCCETAAES